MHPSEWDGWNQKIKKQKPHICLKGIRQLAERQNCGKAVMVSFTYVNPQATVPVTQSSANLGVIVKVLVDVIKVFNHFKVK